MGDRRNRHPRTPPCRAEELFAQSPSTRSRCGDLRGGARQRRRRPITTSAPGRTSSSPPRRAAHYPLARRARQPHRLRHRSPTSSTRYSRPSSKSVRRARPHPPAPARTTHRRRAARPPSQGLDLAAEVERDAAQRRRSPPGALGAGFRSDPDLFPGGPARPLLSPDAISEGARLGIAGLTAPPTRPNQPRRRPSDDHITAPDRSPRPALGRCARATGHEVRHLQRD